MILYFSSFSVYPSRKCIYRRFAVSPSRAAQVPHMLGFPFLIPACFWKSKTLHYISRKEETTWGNKTRLEKNNMSQQKEVTTVEQSICHVQATFHESLSPEPWYGNSPTVFQHRLWVVFSQGNRRSILAGSHGSPCCLRLAVPCCLHW